MSLNILLADDHLLFRHAIRALLEQQYVGNLCIVGEASNGNEVLDFLLKSAVKPDVIIMDLDMPELNGIETMRRISSLRHSAKVIAVSVYADKQHIKQMLNAGAMGYVLKASAGSELLRAIQTVIDHRVYICPEISDTLIDMVCDQRSKTIELGQRERELLILWAEGWRAEDIAKRMRITLSTIQTHRRNIMRKLDIHSSVELTKYAIREGLTKA